MRKHRSVFSISLQQELAYRPKLVIDRLRNALQIFLIFFLWDSVFSDPGREVFGYDRGKMLTYVFGLLIVKAVVFSSRASDLSGMISNGELTNYLLKPVGFLRYWFSRDISSRVIHTTLSIIEASILYLIIRPPFFLQSDAALVLAFLIMTAAAMVSYFLMLTIVSMIPFWMPEQSWPPVFLFLTVSEMLSGAIFPLDILPTGLVKALYLTPFPYLVFVPLQVYLGKMGGAAVGQSIGISVAWMLVLGFAVDRVWRRGIVSYRAEGR